MYILSISVLLYAFLLCAHAIDRPHSRIPYEGSAHLRRSDSTGEADTTNSAGTSAVKHVLVGASNRLAVYDFNGTAFKLKTTNNTYKGKASWLTFKEPNLLYANQEDGLNVRLFHYDPLTGDLSPQIEEFAAPLGVRHLAWNANKTVLIGSAYDQGYLTVWDATDPQGKLKTINIYGLGEGVHQPHQAVLDPTGQFFVVNDSGGDQLVILNNGMKYGIWDHIPVTPTGSAPKHGVFLTFEADKINGVPGATYYVVTCSKARTVQLFKVDYPTSTTISFEGIQTISSSGPLPPLNQGTAEASDVVVYGKSSLVVTNSFTGNTTELFVLLRVRES